jgi:hypothetical protein
MIFKHFDRYLYLGEGRGRQGEEELVNLFSPRNISGKCISKVCGR